MVDAKTPTLAVIKNQTSLADVRALLYIAICEVCDFFNVGKNMTDTQVALTADLIIESYWHLKLEEIKFCFRRAMRREKLYDRLDGNIILGWLDEYDAERTEEAIKQSENDDAKVASAQAHAEGTMSLEEYVLDLKAKVDAGDEEAAKNLAMAERYINAPLIAQCTRETRSEFEAGFREFYLQFKSGNLKREKLNG